MKPDTKESKRLPFFFSNTCDVRRVRGLPIFFFFFLCTCWQPDTYIWLVNKLFLNSSWIARDPFIVYVFVLLQQANCHCSILSYLASKYFRSISLLNCVFVWWEQRKCKDSSMLNPPEIHLCNQRLPPNAIRDHEMRARSSCHARPMDSRVFSLESMNSLVTPVSRLLEQGKFVLAFSW